MTREELIQEKELAVSKLNNEIRQLRLHSKECWRPERHEDYFYVGAGLGINQILWIGSEFDKAALGQGNCFKSEEGAKAYKDYLEAQVTIRESAGWWQPDWSDSSQGKWVVFYDYSDDDWHVRVRNVIYYQGCIYFPSEELLAKSLENCRDAWETVRKWEAGERS